MIPPENTPDNNPAAMLARIDERTHNMEKDIKGINKALDTKYVTQHQFKPVARIVYGLVGTALASIAGALYALVINR